MWNCSGKGPLLVSLLSERGTNGNEAAAVGAFLGPPTIAQEASQPATRQEGRGEMAKVID